MTLYLDTACWYRPFENHTIQARLDEQESIISILEENETGSPTFEILSCKLQVNQVYDKLHSLNTSPDEKLVLPLIIDSIETHTRSSTNKNPFQVKQFLNNFVSATNLPDSEDSKQIITSWILRADYFLTTDYSTILNINDNRQIETFLDSQIHPILGTHGNIVEIRDPVTRLKELLSN